MIPPSQQSGCHGRRSQFPPPRHKRVPPLPGRLPGEQRSAWSERLYAAIIEKRLTHPDDPTLNQHVRAAVARQTERGWRLDKTKTREQIDAVVALAMAVKHVERRPATVELLGWI